MDLDDAIDRFVSRYQNPSTRKEALWALKTWSEHPEPNPAWKPATVHVFNAFASSFCRFAKEQGLDVPEPPTGGPRPKQAPPIGIPADDTRKLLAVIGGERQVWRTFFTLLLETGIRCREGIRLTVGDISWQPGQECLLVRTAKGSYGRRVPMVQQMASAALLRQVVAPMAPEAYVFAGSTSDRPLTASAARYRFRSLCRKADLVDDEGRALYQIHQLRHTVAGRWVDGGVDARAVQRILGLSRREARCQPVLDDAQARLSLEEHVQELYP